MIIKLESTMNPGPNARFVIGVDFTKRDEVYQDRYWWGVYLHFWLLTWQKRKKWFFDYENSDEGSWKTFKIMLCGFEFIWERLDKKKGGTW